MTSARRKSRHTARHRPSVFDAVAEPTRRSILDNLRTAPDGRTVNQIAANYRMSRPAISKHLRVLRRAALVHERRQGRERVYRLTARPLGEIDEWLTAYRLHWAATLMDLKEFVETEQERSGESA